MCAVQVIVTREENRIDGLQRAPRQLSAARKARGQVPIAVSRFLLKSDRLGPILLVWNALTTIPFGRRRQVLPLVAVHKVLLAVVFSIARRASEALVAIRRS